MRRIRLRDATYQALRAVAIGEFRSTGERLPDGGWLVPIDEQVWARIQAIRMGEESDDDVVARVIHLTGGGRLS
jgi:hypothetical protein